MVSMLVSFDILNPDIRTIRPAQITNLKSVLRFKLHSFNMPYGLIWWANCKTEKKRKTGEYYPPFLA